MAEIYSYATKSWPILNGCSECLLDGKEWSQMPEVPHA